MELMIGSVDEARTFWQSLNVETLKGKRNRAIIAALLGCGLRRRTPSANASRSPCRAAPRVREYARDSVSDYLLDRHRHKSLCMAHSHLESA
jgi:hypothetical protein